MSRVRVSIIEHYHDQVKAGGLISQSVEHGTLLVEGHNSIVLYYSLGLPYIPNLAGESENEVVLFFAKGYY